MSGSAVNADQAAQRAGVSRHRGRLLRGRRAGRSGSGPDGVPRAGAAAPTAYVANTTAGTVTPIDTATNRRPGVTRPGERATRR
jgi:hypothetical protein